MATRLELQAELEGLLGSKHVYYQSPASVHMEYPAIRYSKEAINKTTANNSTYMLNNRYQLIVIDRRPDNAVIEKLLKLPMCRHDRRYISDNLYHDVLTLYY